MELPIDNILDTDLQNLIENSVPESKTLDYKRDLPGSSDPEKKEFLADVTSFANTNGGHIVYGISEAVDETGSNTGRPLEMVGLNNSNLDQEILRFEQTLRTAINPKVNGIKFKKVNVGTTPLLIIYIPKSWNSPHMVTFRGGSKFHGRGNSGKFTMDVEDIRLAFSNSEGLTERIKEFRADRIIQIKANQGIMQLTGDAKIVAHLIPLYPNQPVDLTSLYTNQIGLIAPWSNSNGFDYNHNLDGFSTHWTINTNTYSYTQIFRNGIFEAVDSFSLCRENTTNKLISADGFARSLFKVIQNGIKAQQTIGVTSPIFCMVSVLNVKQYRFYIGNVLPFENERLIQHQDLVFNDIMIDKFEFNVQTTLRPLLDQFWQAAGYERCLRYENETYSFR